MPVGLLFFNCLSNTYSPLAQHRFIHCHVYLYNPVEITTAKIVTSLSLLQECPANSLHSTPSAMQLKSKSFGRGCSPGTTKANEIFLGGNWYGILCWASRIHRNISEERDNCFAVSCSLKSPVHSSTGCKWRWCWQTSICWWEQEPSGILLGFLPSICIQGCSRDKFHRLHTTPS